MESGLILEGAVSENRLPESAVRESLNFDFDKIGSATVRKGLTRLGSALPSALTGLHYFIDSVSSAGTKTQLIAVSAGTAYYLSGGSFASIRSGLTASSKARFTDFLNFTFMVNGTEATAVWNGDTASSFVTTGNALSAPKGQYVATFRNRVWIAGNQTDVSNPDALYYSTPFSATVGSTVTWDQTNQSLFISPHDGETFTALHRTRNNLLVFKQNHIYRVYSISQSDPDPYYAVGTSSQESVIETKNGVYFHHSSGFYHYNIYGIIQEISRPIIDIIRAIPASSYTSVAGWLEPDGDHINWSVGTVMVNGVTYTNLVVRYTISTQVWTHRTYPTQFLVAADYSDGTTKFKVVGDSAGNIYETNTGLTDDGTTIIYSLIHRWDNLDGMLSTRKTVQAGMFSHDGGAGTNVAYQIDGDPALDWSRGVGQLRDQNTGFNSMGIKGRKTRFRLSGSSRGEPFTYHGYELVGVENEPLQFPN